MNINEMHISIDLGTQMLNSSALLKLPSEGKDLYLNRAIRNIIKGEIQKEVNTVYNVATYQDIREHYNTLGPLVYSTDIQEHSAGYRYNAFLLPTTTRTQISSGRLTAGVTYRVVTAGTTDLSGFGGLAVPVVGSTFTCAIPNLTSGDTHTTGNQYTIQNNSSAPVYAFTLLGANDNVDGTSFTCTVTAAFAPVNGAYCLTLTDSPSWAGGTVLEQVFTYDYDHMFVIKANVDHGSNFVSGALEAGEKYKVVTAGATSLLAYGHKTTPVAGEVFLCTASGTPTWDGTTTLIKTVDKVCRLMKPQDTESALDHAFGTTHDSPIAEIVSSADGELVKVYNDASFDVNQINVVYVRKPDKVNKTTSVDCNLHENIHDIVVEGAIALIKLDDDRLKQQSQ